MKRAAFWFPALALLAWLSPGWGAAESGAGDAIVLPPFLVEDEGAGFGFDRPVWLYGQSAGYEVLSACGEDQTQYFIQALEQQRAALSQFIPDDFLLRTDLPTTLILFPQSLRHTMESELQSEFERKPVGAEQQNRFSPIQDLRLTDPDSSYLFVILTDWNAQHWNGYVPGRGADIVYSPSYFQFLVDSRAPVLPDWFVVGITRLYQTMVFPDEEKGWFPIDFLTHKNSLDLLSAGSNGEKIEGFDPDPWLSREAVSALRSDSGAVRPLLPMRELFVANIPAGKSPDYLKVWRAQAELFTRWAFSDKVKLGRQSLQRFVSALSRGPANEELFRTCFRLDYADARDALSDFLPEAVRKPVDVNYDPIRIPSPMDLREATVEEIHRIKGEWGRRALRAIRADFPAGLPVYIAKTRKELQGAFDRGERDPRLIASLALFRIDTGDAEGARSLLEQHPEALTARPQARLDLAKIHLENDLAHPGGLRGALSEDQASVILRDITAVLHQAPPLEEAYVLAGRLAKHLGRDPTEQERQRLEEGSLLFPRNAHLVMETAAWDLRTGRQDTARRLLELGLWEAADPADGKKLEFLDDLAAKASMVSTDRPDPR